MPHQGAAIWHELGDRLAEASSLNLIGLIHLRARRLIAAYQHFEQALAVFQEADSAYSIATALSNLATARRSAGDPEALTIARRALSAHRALGNRRGEGNILRILSHLERESGDLEQALASALAAVDIALSLRDDHAGRIGFFPWAMPSVQTATWPMPSRPTSVRPCCTAG